MARSCDLYVHRHSSFHTIGPSLVELSGSFPIVRSEPLIRGRLLAGLSPPPVLSHRESTLDATLSAYTIAHPMSLPSSTVVPVVR